jgi:hypothetical protein
MAAARVCIAAACRKMVLRVAENFAVMAYIFKL